MSRYGPHRDEDNPTSVTIFGVLDRQVSVPAVILDQRAQINTVAHEEDR